MSQPKVAWGLHLWGSCYPQPFQSMEWYLGYCSTAGENLHHSISMGIIMCTSHSPSRAPRTEAHIFFQFYLLMEIVSPHPMRSTHSMFIYSFLWGIFHSKNRHRLRDKMKSYHDTTAYKSFLLFKQFSGMFFSYFQVTENSNNNIFLKVKGLTM